MSRIEFKKLKSRDEKEDYLKNNENRINQQNIFINNFEVELNKYNNYNNETKHILNDMAKNLITELFGDQKCWATHCIDKSLKKDLINNMKKIFTRMQEHNNELLTFIEEEKEKLEEVKKYINKKEKGRALMVRIYNDPDYMDFRTPCDQREWDCLENLIEDGDVTENQLSDYGIFLSI